MIYLRESEASAANETATTNVFCSESKAAATIVLSVRKRSDSNNKAPSRNGNQPHVLVMSPRNTRTGEQ